MSTTDTTKKEVARVIQGGYLRATAQLRQLNENQRPYFSVTGELWDSQRWYENGNERHLQECGCIHDLILKAFPDLAPVVALHLADDRGVPMHAEANGWYAYSSEWHQYDAEKGTPRKDTPLELCASILRISKDELNPGMNRAEFGAFVESLKPRWQAEADTAKALLS